MRAHIGTLLAGITFLGVGVAFVLEAQGVWTMGMGELRLVLPIALVVGGMALIGGAARSDAR